MPSSEISNAVAKLMAVMIQRVLADLKLDLEAGHLLAGQSVLLQVRRTRDNVYIDIQMEFQRRAGGAPVVEPLAALESLTTGTKCWHTWRNNGWPASSFGGSGSGYRIDISSMSGDATPDETPPKEETNAQEARLPDQECGPV